MGESNWYKGLVNAHQTPAERRTKYAYCKQQGLSVSLSRRCSSWRWSKIYRLLGKDGDRHTARQLFDFGSSR